MTGRQGDNNRGKYKRGGEGERKFKNGTQHRVRINPDGSRTYSNGTTYYPVKKEDRAYPNGPQNTGKPGFWFGTVWLPPLTELLDDDKRVMPETVPDEIALWHEYGCLCFVCKRPAALWWKRRKVPGVTPEEVRSHLNGPIESGRSEVRPRDAETEAGY